VIFLPGMLWAFDSFSKDHGSPASRTRPEKA